MIWIGVGKSGDRLPPADRFKTDQKIGFCKNLLQAGPEKTWFFRMPWLFSKAK
jgi:hypothetical protein